MFSSVLDRLLPVARRWRGGNSQRADTTSSIKLLCRAFKILLLFLRPFARTAGKADRPPPWSARKRNCCARVSGFAKTETECIKRSKKTADSAFPPGTVRPRSPWSPSRPGPAAARPSAGGGAQRHRAERMQMIRERPRHEFDRRPRERAGNVLVIPSRIKRDLAHGKTAGKGAGVVIHHRFKSQRRQISDAAADPIVAQLVCPLVNPRRSK